MDSSTRPPWQPQVRAILAPGVGSSEPQWERFARLLHYRTVRAGEYIVQAISREARLFSNLSHTYGACDVT